MLLFTIQQRLGKSEAHLPKYIYVLRTFTHFFVKNYVKRKQNAINPPLLQSTGGPCVIYTIFRRGADLHSKTANVLTFQGFYLDFVFSFPFDAQDRMTAKATSSP